MSHDYGLSKEIGRLRANVTTCAHDEHHRKSKTSMTRLRHSHDRYQKYEVSTQLAYETKKIDADK